MPRQANAHSLLVTALLMMNGSDNRQFFGVLGKERNMFAKLHSGGSRVDRFELSSKIDRRLGFRVEGLVMAHSSPSVDDDAGLGFAGQGSRRCTGFQKGRQGQSGQSYSGLKKFPPRVINTQHLGLLLAGKSKEVEAFHAVEPI